MATMKAKEVLALIRKHSDSLMVNVTAQGMAFADFLDEQGIHARRVRVGKGGIISPVDKTAAESPRV